MFAHFVNKRNVVCVDSFNVGQSNLKTSIKLIMEQIYEIIPIQLGVIEI